MDFLYLFNEPGEKPFFVNRLPVWELKNSVSFTPKIEKIRFSQKTR
jgi:hypothetical protein